MQINGIEKKAVLDLPLDTYYGYYREGLIDKKRLEGRIFQHVLDNHAWFGVYYTDKNDCADFLVWLYPRMVTAIDRYENKGMSFDGYINSIMRFSFREYRKIETIHSITEDSVWREKAQEVCRVAHFGKYGPDGVLRADDTADEAAAGGRILNPRQILMLLLKSYYFVDEEFVGMVAPAIGIPVATVNTMLEQIRLLRVEADNHVRGLKERIYSQYYRCLSFERRLEYLSPESPQSEKLATALELGRKRLAAMRKRLNAMRLDASNRQVAEVLGVSKGTVDSNLYSFKNYHANGKQKRGRKQKSRFMAADSGE